ncbi:Tat pathway signal protein [Streptomyces varsoviensis]|uniref:Tat pathway signal protein n=1 Tax=Streptomyces varsoviensis TaxID=67373 RepID=UPI0033E96813
MARVRNVRLEAVVRELGWPQERLAAHFRRTAVENRADELISVTRSHINQWIRGSRPGGRAPTILRETLSRGLGRVVTLTEIGLAPDGGTQAVADWDVDTLVALADLGGADMDRRDLLANSAYSLAGAALPADRWWEDTLQRARTRSSVSRFTVADAHVESVREAMAFFSRRDQRLGGRAGHAALIAYLKTDVADYVSGRFPSERVRRDLMAAAGELVYLAGWMAFDSSEHATAQKAFTLAVKLAAEAEDAPLAGHILRAMAHQCVDLGHPDRALAFAAGSLERGRYALASPREKALLGVVHARALAVAGRAKDARAALRRAEEDLGHAGSSDTGEPARVFFFGEASLAHEMACTLRDLGDLKSAEAEFGHSVRTRRVQPFARTHAVTLGYLGDVQVRRGQLDAACVTWAQGLDAMTGVQSGRARETVVQMRRALSPVRGRGGALAAELDERARAVLRRIG